MSSSELDLVVMSRMRLAIGRRMVDSKREAPHFYASTDVEMDATLSLLENGNGSGVSGVRLSVTAALVRACAAALAEHPQFNSVWTAEGLMRSRKINIGVAVAVEGGVIAPAILDCANLGLAEIAVAVHDLASRARAQKLGGREVTDATFTLSNLGMFDVTTFAGIVTPPQVAILAAGRVAARPVVVNGQVAIRHVLTATVSADHRAVDGVEVARFLMTFKHELEIPQEMRTGHVPLEA